jgi:hypothetical protein
MHRTLKVFQLNVRKQREVQQSVMNDQQLQDFGIIALSEPHSFIMDGVVTTVPLGHAQWTKMIPGSQHEGRWAIRSMLWIRKDIESEQVTIQSSDLTAALLYLPDRAVFVASVYVEPANPEALLQTIDLLQLAIQETQHKIGTRMDILLAGDFNQHDCLWGGDEVSPTRQGEADMLVDFMNDLSLRSLLPRGTKTWQSGRHESTIDLTLASEELASTMIQCRIHSTEHGSDHLAIETAFDIAIPEHTTQARLLFKNAPWTKIKEKIASALLHIPTTGNVQIQTDRLMKVVLAAIEELTPKAKPSPYAKRWWTKDLTHLRRSYTFWRNRSRSQRRIGRIDLELEGRAQSAAKEYHDAIRKQQQTHWDEFLEDDANIWQAAKYLDASNGYGSSKIPPLQRSDGTTTRERGEQADELLATFFPPLPPIIVEEGTRPQREPVYMPCLEAEEIERCIFAAKPWKAAGEDGLPTIVWRQIWPAVKDRILTLFRTSIETGQIPVQWKTAKIVPLRKPNKDDYTRAKAWRPISLLCTLGKILEAVVAERISHAVETRGLLPTNHFGARKKRSAEQALILLQEQIYQAWRAKKVLSLISFDVKGAYNGVCKERLIERLAARGIPSGLVRWIGSFCSDRTATVVVNGYSSPRTALQQAGLPQGSPLSPMLFLFFNADLVQRQIDRNGGAIAFVDDYTAWVTGTSAASNRQGIQAVIQKAMEWERRSGATFEEDKTAFIHFTRSATRVDNQPISIKGQQVAPVTSTKILGVVMDAGLRYKQHVARAATKGLKAAMALKRLRGLSPSTARRLFEATVVPTVDYASSAWMHTCSIDRPALNRVQRIGAQAVTGCFRTVATHIAEAEASLRTVQERHAIKATGLWVNFRTLPKTNPLTKISTKSRARFISPMQKIASMHQDAAMDRLEHIKPYALEPWVPRLQASIDVDIARALGRARQAGGIRVTTSASARNETVGYGGVIQDTNRILNNGECTTYSITHGLRSEQNPYTASLVAILEGLLRLAPAPQRRLIHIISSDQGALQAISKPRHQSGQTTIKSIYEVVQKLRGQANHISLIWAPLSPEFELGQIAKAAAQRATEIDQTPQSQCNAAKSTISSTCKARRKPLKLNTQTGQHLRRIDTALPGPHTRLLYNSMKRKQASVLAQLRTGMSRLNNYLFRINAAETDQCTCGQGTETVEHFLLWCRQWDVQRQRLLQTVGPRRGNLSFFLGGKATTDDKNWAPNMEAVQASIKFAIDTGRLDMQRDEQSVQSQNQSTQTADQDE